MILLISALTMGLILALMAMGLFISYRLFQVADITVDGSITFGGAVTALAIVRGGDPLTAALLGLAAGFVAGLATGILSTRFRINPLLAGILTMTALYSVNLRVMGKSNISLHETVTLSTWCERLGKYLFGQGDIFLAGWAVPARDVLNLAVMFLLVLFLGTLLWFFFRTHFGLAMRAAGDNPQMARAQGVSVENRHILGIALANGLTGLAGALLVQYQGFADVQMGIGMVVIGLASVIIGEAFSDRNRIGLAIAGAVVGSVLFRLLTAIILRWGLNPNDLKLITALFVFAALVFPQGLRTLVTRFSRRPGAPREV